METYLGAAYPNLGSRTNHVERNDDVRTLMRPVYPSYKALYDVSRKCRYDADYYASFDDAVASDEDAAEIREFVPIPSPIRRS